MDLYQLTIAQSDPKNQFCFDADQFEQAVLRSEERRALLKRGWTRCRAFLTGIGKTPAFSSKIVTRNRIA